MVRSLFRANNNFEMNHCLLIKWKIISEIRCESDFVRANQITETEDRLISVLLNLKFLNGIHVSNSML